MKPIKDWIVERLGNEVVEIPGWPVEGQLRKHDRTGSGIGFVLLFAMVSLESDGEVMEATHRTLMSVPIVRIRNEWLTMEDENLQDILSGIVRLVAPESFEEINDDRPGIEPQGS